MEWYEWLLLGSKRWSLRSKGRAGLIPLYCQKKKTVMIIMGIGSVVAHARKEILVLVPFEKRVNENI